MNAYLLQPKMPVTTAAETPPPTATKDNTNSKQNLFLPLAVRAKKINDRIDDWPVDAGSVLS